MKVRLAAQVSDYEKGMLAAARATATVGTEAEKLAQKRQAFNQLGQGLVLTGTALTAVTALSIKAAAGWESAWAGVTKTVEGTPEELSRVEDGLRSLTSVLPASHDEIAAVAEAAGQLGIETSNVVAFTRTMIDMGETTNLSANDAATAMARFTNIMGTSQDKVSNLGSAIVGLGNNYATTEAEIMEMAMRLAGAGKQIGLTEGEVLGLSTALSSVGIEAEAGGSAMSKVMINIAASVEEGGDKLEKFATAAGMSGEKFAQLWKQDSAAALAAFVKGLSNAEAQGKSTLGMLSELGITEVRMRDALLRSSAAAGQFSQAMADGNRAFEENNALTVEAAKRYATVESRIAIAGNAVRDAAIDFGQVFLPAVGAAADGVADFAQFMGGLPDPVQGILGVLTSTVGLFALAGGAALLAVPKIAEFKLAMETLGLSMRTIGMVGGGALIALTALVTVVGAVSAAQAAAEQKAQSYADTLAEGTRKVTKATREMIATNLTADQSFLWVSQGSLADNAETLGLSLATVTDAIAGNADALETVNAAINGGLLEGKKAMRDADMEAFNAATLLKGGLEGEIGALDLAAEKARQRSEATDQGAKSSLSAADAFQSEAEAAADLTSELTGLIDRINEANGVAVDAITANANYLAAIDGLKAQAERLGFSLDETTVAGSANAAAMGDIAEKAREAAAAQFVQDRATMSSEEAAVKYNETLAAQRQAFIDSAVQAGYNAAEVQALADRIYQMPTEKEFKALVETAEAQAKLDGFVWTNTGRRVKVYVDAVAGSSYRVGSITVSSGDGMARGGPVVGHGPKGVDSELRMLAPGEHVLTAAEVDAAGGHAAVMDWRQSLVSGGGGQPVKAAPVWVQPSAAAGSGGDSSAVVEAIVRLQGEVAALNGSLGRPNLTFNNPVSRDMKSDAWEAAQIVGVE